MFSVTRKCHKDMFKTLFFIGLFLQKNIILVNFAPKNNKIQLMKLISHIFLQMSGFFLWKLLRSIYWTKCSLHQDGLFPIARQLHGMTSWFIQQAHGLLLYIIYASGCSLNQSASLPEPLPSFNLFLDTLGAWRASIQAAEWLCWDPTKR